MRMRNGLVISSKKCLGQEQLNVQTSMYDEKHEQNNNKCTQLQTK
jgi:hypothetical protein